MSTTTAALRAREALNAPANLPARPAKSMQEIARLPKDKQFPALLDSFKREIALALPKHITPDRMARLAMTAFSQNPKLAQCEPRSVFSAVILSSQLGLEIGVDGQAYIVPYFDNRAGCYKAQFIPGWKGYVELINRAGRATVWTGVVFKGDKFEYQLGARPECTHQPMGETDETEANVTHAYAIGQVHGSPIPVIEVWPKARIVRHRDKFNKVGETHYSKSNDDAFIGYARKVPLLQVMKYMPKSIEVRAAEAVEHGGQFNLADVLEGEWSTVAADATAARDDHGADPADNNEHSRAGEAPPSADSGASGSAAASPDTLSAPGAPGSPSSTGRRARIIE